MNKRKISSLQPSSARTPAFLCRLVADAIENERALDERYRVRFTNLPPSGLVPNFKVMKQLALQARLGPLYPILIALAPIAVLLAVPWQWLLLLIGAASSLKAALPVEVCRVLATTESNLAIIYAALDSDPRIAHLPRHQIHFDSRAIGAEIGWSGCILAMRAHFRFLVYVLTRPTRVRRDLLLHGHDALALLGLSQLALNTGHIFVTDDHYQRWAHVMSHAAEDFRIVQHGFLDEELVLPHAGGAVTCLYLRALLFRASFMRYYAIVEHWLFSPPAKFDPTSISSNALLIASSFPSIELEIKLLDAIRACCGTVPIIVKFHPAHKYDSRREQLAARATTVYEGTGNPACRVFASHNSFMEFDYRQHGVATVSIARCGSVEAAANEIKFFLANSGPS